MLKQKEFYSIVYSEYIKLYPINENNLTNYYSMLRMFFYLVEWKYSLTYDKRITNIKWVNYHGLPSILDKNLKFLILENLTKTLNNNVSCDDVDLMLVIKFCLDKYEKYPLYTDRCHLVSSTYPIVSTYTNDKLDLLKLSTDYKNEYNINSKDWLINLKTLNKN